MRLVDKEHARHDVRLALLPPLSHLGVDLLAHLRPYLARVAREQRQEPLRGQAGVSNKMEHTAPLKLLKLLNTWMCLQACSLAGHGQVPDHRITGTVLHRQSAPMTASQALLYQCNMHCTCMPAEHRRAAPGAAPACAS